MTFNSTDQRSLKTGPLIWAVILILVGGGAGYWLRAQRGGEESVLAAGAVPALDSLIAPESFSRIKNARNSLEGLRVRLRLQVASSLLAEHFLVGGRGASGQRPEPCLEGAIRDLERGMEEFEGTEQELYCAQDLFPALKTAGRFDRWIEVYLKGLYEHPTHPVVARFAKEAIALGRATGREEEVLAGLRHLSAIPLDFEGKDTVQATLIEARPGKELARIYARHLPANQ
jgi:hypothetical protein